MRLCGKCKARPRKKHLNSKWCHPCAEELKTRPKGTLSPSQIRFAVKHAGDMKIDEIAKKFKTSRANVKRSCRGTRFYSHNGKYMHRPNLVLKVLEYYFEHGKKATQKAFPRVNVKCIVDRPDYYGIDRKYRQLRWSEPQIIELAKMAGVVSMPSQAKFFNRPGANAGSIKSVWSKRMNSCGGSINGLSWFMAKHFVDRKCPRIKTEYWNTRTGKNSRHAHKGRFVVTWVDLEKHLQPESPKWLRDCAKTMSKFQVWLHQTKRPRQRLIKLMEEREQ